jgi:hypothetical protein
VSRSPDGFHPLLAIHHLTSACRRDGRGVRSSERPSPTLRTADVLALYARIRRRCDHLVIAGGEPLDHPEAEAILFALPHLGFDGVVLTTRGASLEAHLDAVETGVDQLVVSLDTLDPEKGDAWLGQPGAHAAILRSLHLLAARPRRHASVIISTVARPGGRQPPRRAGSRRDPRGGSGEVRPRAAVRAPLPLFVRPRLRPRPLPPLDRPRRGVADAGRRDPPAADAAPPEACAPGTSLVSAPLNRHGPQRENGFRARLALA